jgi:hypothetical protein
MTRIEITRNQRMLMLAALLLVVAFVANGCELSLNNVDCSFINQPDMGGLVCFGVNVLALQAVALAAIAAFAALLAALGGALPV